MPVVDLNFSILNNGVRSAWRETSQTMGQEFQAVITEPIHPWPRGDSPRDIVDTGALRDSQIMVLVTPFITRFLYPVDHAIYVRDGTENMPGRDWGAIALARKPLLTIFAEAIKGYL
jgi:hypothetical protein